MEPNEQELCRKLLANHHLSVSERRALPNGQARFSVLISAVQEALSESGWFPFQLIPGRDIGEGAVLESRDGEIWVHEQHEVAVSRYSPIRSSRASGIADAVRAYIEANGGGAIDGVAIDWRA